jgi:hypothetical protein
MLTYLDDCGNWINDRRQDLDRLDRKVQATSPQGVTDIAMTLTVWQAIKDRYTDLVKVWDSGRVLDIDLKKIAVMIWANLNDMLTPGTTISSGGGLAVSLPEACRMLEALISQLSSRYELAPVSTETTARITQLLAQVERIREQAKLDPPGIREATEAQVANLASGVKDLVEKANRGGDIGGFLGPLEVRASLMERDLIVSHAERAMLAQKVGLASQRRTSMIQREHAVTEIVRKTRSSVDPAPKYAVPSVEALGEIPTTQGQLEEYMKRLDQVNAAFDVVQQANQQALAAKSSLTARFEKAYATLGSADPLTASLATQIRDLMGQSPTPIAVVEPLINAFEATGGDR